MATVGSRGEDARRTCFITALGAVLGVVGGGAAWVLLHLIGLITNLALFHRWGWTVPSFENFQPNFTLVIAAVLGGLVVTLLAKWSPVIRGHGLPEAMEAVLTKQSRISPRAAVAKPLSAAVAIGTGGPFGAEGPIIVTGGAVGSLIGQVIRVTPSERKVLLACGAAAGMAATFGAPLAAVVLAIELLLFEFSHRALIPLIVASGVAGAMHSALFGAGPLFHVPPHRYAGLDTLPVFLGVGIACGLLAVVICKGLFLVEDGYRRLPVSEFWHPMIGAVVFASIGLAVPDVLGVGYGVINDILEGRIAVDTLGVLLVAKLGAWWAALGSGTSGGTLAPILLISGAFGSLLGTLTQNIAPELHISPGAMALVAMAATFGASTRATFTAIVFAFELTQDYRSIVPIMLATAVADLVAGMLLDHRLMTEKLARRGLSVPLDFQPDYLQNAFVRDTMSTTVITLDESVTVDDALRTIAETAHSAFPLVDGAGHCVGIVSRDDLLAEESAIDAPVSQVASPDVVSVSPDDTLFSALTLIIDEEIDHLPVVDTNGALIGICTRTDILRARREHTATENRRGPGPEKRPGGRWRRRASTPPSTTPPSGR